MISRRSIALSVVSLWAIAAVGSASVAHEQTALDIDVTVTDYGNLSDKITVTELTLELRNNEPDPVPIAVATWTQQRKTQHPWNIVEGPDTLPANRTTELVVEAPRPLFGIRPGDPAQVTVKTEDGQRQAVAHITIPVSEVENATAR